MPGRVLGDWSLLLETFFSALALEGNTSNVPYLSPPVRGLATGSLGLLLTQSGCREHQSSRAPWGESSWVCVSERLARVLFGGVSN